MLSFRDFFTSLLASLVLADLGASFSDFPSGDGSFPLVCASTCEGGTGGFPASLPGAFVGVADSPIRTPAIFAYTLRASFSFHSAMNF